MKAFIALLMEKIPPVKQDNTFTFILSVVKENKIKALDQLKEYLVSNIEEKQRWLDENKEGTTINTIRREYAKKLSYLKAAHKLVSDYL